MPPRVVHHSPVRIATARRGISLLEVLISMFTLSVGLLGMASLIAVGTHHSSNATRIDHASACGQAALREIRVRRMLEPGRWVTASGNFIDSDQLMRPVLIDPLGINGPAAATDFPNSGSLQMPRVEISTVTANAFNWSLDNSVAPPAGDDLGRPTLQGFAGRYSWMAMVEPSKTENFAQLPLAQRRKFNVAVVVFYQRDLTDLEETQFSATLTGGGGATLTGAGDQDIKPGQWILFSGTWNPPSDGVPTTAASRQYHRWYQVLNVSEHPSNNDVFVMLSGPTWPDNAMAGGATATATVVNGVVAVYERAVELDVAF